MLDPAQYRRPAPATTPTAVPATARTPAAVPAIAKPPATMPPAAGPIMTGAPVAVPEGPVTGAPVLPTDVPSRHRTRGRTRGRARRLAGLCGPAFVVSVAYVDPGNFATNMSGGARHGYLLLWVIAAANLVAMFVQSLSAKLGIATGRSLPRLCRDRLPRPVVRLLWLQAELVAVATDLAEFIGGAIALNLLFGVPLLPAAGITATVSCVLLMLAPRGRHRFEIVIAGLLGSVLAGFAYQSLRAGSLGGAAGGFVPRLDGTDSMLLATGIVGATVMPHVIYLHSELTSRQGEPPGSRAALRSSRVDIAVALGAAGVVNMVMLTVAAAAFGGADPGGLGAIHHELGRLLGPGAAVAFALALLASGLASSSVGTYGEHARLQRRVELAAPAPPLAEHVQPVQAHLPEPLPDGQQPLLRPVLEQILAEHGGIETVRTGPCVRGPLVLRGQGGHGPVDAPDVDIDAVRQRHPVAGAADQVDGMIAAEPPQRRAQVGDRPAVGELRPQGGRRRRPGGEPAPRRQKGQQPLRARRDGHRPVRVPQLERAEQPEVAAGPVPPVLTCGAHDRPPRNTTSGGRWTTRGPSLFRPSARPAPLKPPVTGTNRAAALLARPGSHLTATPP
ncbi:Nramp family divalent metal transporter [Actinomadura fibrosa]|uniref:Nramp family divalent metal transporter n=1 Tax=Actinomadura fibrosa TaxID=111802 RepID=A0ABW2XGC6_9ACTN|nr:Nramp family divalent metal transporter [Actinomadura fibrosa]